jgi:F420-non-reducing hydrogenase iron-sulfur subunit
LRWISRDEDRRSEVGSLKFSIITEKIENQEREDMKEWEPKIVSFLCNWCSYGAADLAGVSRMEYPPHIRVIRIPCTGRMSPKFILAAFRQGADGVWVSG